MNGKGRLMRFSCASCTGEVLKWLVLCVGILLCMEMQWALAEDKGDKSDEPPVARPAVWWRATPRENHADLWVPAQYAQAPQRSPAVYLMLSREYSGKKPGTLIEFFSGKRERFKRYENIDAQETERIMYADGYTHPMRRRVILNDGKRLGLILISRGGWDALIDNDDEFIGDVRPIPHAPFPFVLSTISALPIVMDKFVDKNGVVTYGETNNKERIWLNPSAWRPTALDQGLLCDPLYWAVQARNHVGKIIWRKIFAAHGPLLKRSLGPSGRSGADPYHDGCYSPGQYEMESVRGITLVLDDGTALLDLGYGILRIHVAEGRPDVIPDNVSIRGYDNSMRLKSVLWGFHSIDIFSEDYKSRLSPGERKRAYRRERWSSEDTHIARYLILQHYMFPQRMPR